MDRCTGSMDRCTRSRDSVLGAGTWTRSRAHIPVHHVPYMSVYPYPTMSTLGTPVRHHGTLHGGLGDT